MKEINISSQRVDGNPLIQQKVMTNIQYQIKIKRKIKFDKFCFDGLFNIKQEYLSYSVTFNFEFGCTNEYL